MNILDTLIKMDTRDFNLKTATAVLVADPGLKKLEHASLAALAWFYQQSCKKEARKLKLDNPLKLVSLFIGRKDRRSYLNYIFSTGEALYGSNGAVAIRVTHKCAPGYYDALGPNGGIEPETKYPHEDLDRALADPGAVEPVDLDIYTNELIGTTQACKFSERYYAKQYIDILKKCGATNARADDVNTLFFDIPNMHATGVLMPLRKP